MQKNILYGILYLQFGAKKKWENLQHNGILFPPDYVPHNIPIKYKNEYIVLSPESEEYAMSYVKYIDSEYIKNKTFNKNFWKDWKKFLNIPDINSASLSDFDFSEYREHYLNNKKCKLEKSAKTKKENTDSDRDSDVESNLESPTNNTNNTNNEYKYKYAVVNGKKEEVGNFRVEPPGIFIGRGDNPNIGKIKKRIYPEDVTINIGKNEKIPDTIEGHSWGEIIHNRDVEWIASWKDTVTDKNKYVLLSHSSDFKANNDQKKFEIARKLKKKIKKIIYENTINLSNNDPKIRQLATALYLIDKLAIRVGNEKSEDDTDTVGVSTLRIEHINLYENKLELNFLGKDSVPYHNVIVIDDLIKNNIESFMNGKDKYDQLFQLISSADINNYLQKFMINLTAKTFRSYNASNILQKEITKINNKYCGQNPDISVLIAEFNKANIKVAKFLNHQKNVGKSHKSQIEKISDQIKKYKKELKKERLKEKKNNKKIKKIKEKIKQLKTKKIDKEELKNIALGTSKENYIDPRITISFMKKNNIPIEKIFSEKLQKKFKWAFDVDENFKF